MLPIDIFSVRFNRELVGIFLDDSYAMSNDNVHNAIQNIFMTMGFRDLSDYADQLPSYKNSDHTFIESRDGKSNYHQHVDHVNKKHEIVFDFTLFHYDNYWGASRPLSIMNQINDLFKKYFDHLSQYINQNDLGCPFTISPTIQEFVNVEWSVDDDINLLWFCEDWYDGCDIKQFTPEIKEESENAELVRAIRIIKDHVRLYAESNTEEHDDDGDSTEQEVLDIMNNVFGP